MAYIPTPNMHIFVISLCVLPLLVIIGWCMDRPLTMNFEPFEAFTLFTTTVILAFVISRGQVQAQGLIHPNRT